MNKSAQSHSSWPRIVLHVDMDAFYAAIEELDHSEYRGKPLVVGADPKEGKGRGVVSTANYEARKYGIHSAMPISQAYRRCPDAVYVGGRPKRYQEVSKQVMNLLRSYSPQIHQISIDEAFLDVSHTAHGYTDPIAMAKSLKSEIADQTGLTASIGMATNMFVAKIASDLQKPDGLTICFPGQEKEFLARLPIKRLWGVGPKTEARLKDAGFTTIGELAKCSQAALAKQYGKWGAHLWELANGIDNRSVEDHSERKSISQEYTFDQDVDDVRILEQRLWQIADDLSADMRQLDIKGRVITLKIRLEGFLTYTRRKSLTEYSNDAELIRAVSLDLFRNFDRQGKKVRLVGIALSNLNNHGAEQLELFAPVQTRTKDKVTRLLDAVRDKFGDESAARASLLGQSRSRFLGAEKIPAAKKNDSQNPSD